jgi:hypothetical protein
MTDFVQWLRENELPQTEQEVKEGRTSHTLDYIRDQDGNAILTGLAGPVKLVAPVEAKAAPAPLGDVDKAKIRELYRQGYSAARVRQTLGLKITLAQIYSIGKRR